MTINFRSMRATVATNALNTIIDLCTEAKLKQSIREILQGQNITTVGKLLITRQEDIGEFTLLEEALDDQNNKIIKTTEVPKTTLGFIKDLRDYALYLSTESNLTDIKELTTDLFDDWQHDQRIKAFAANKNTNPTPTTVTVATPATTGANTTNDLNSRISAIDKWDTRMLPTWNGAVGHYARVKRVTKQQFKNHRLEALTNSNTVARANDGSLTYDLWVRQNAFAVTCMITKFTGGQIGIIIRKHQDSDDAAFKIWTEMETHYESQSNIAAAITQILSQLSNLKFT
jgi:hypothetical protein